MDPLLEMMRAIKKADDYGFEWSHYSQPLQQIIRECEEVQDAMEKGEGPERIEEEVGDIMNAAVSLCLFLGLSPEAVLLKSTQKFEKRMDEVRRQAEVEGLSSLKGQSMDVLERFWKNAKKVTG